ncbi:hypothetical protein, partial [Pseudomonas poae]|uniref:hypothetical protein n=1 Tax=Pseudomonas poae TaxID=200451 RepID=UPI0034D70CE5
TLSSVPRIWGYITCQLNPSHEETRAKGTISISDLGKWKEDGSSLCETTVALTFTLAWDLSLNPMSALCIYGFRINGFNHPHPKA